MTKNIKTIQKISDGQKIKLSVFFVLIIMVLGLSFAFATTPLEYNIIPETKVDSIIDTKAQKKLDFKLYEATDDIFYNGKQVKVKNNSFSIDVSKLSGKQELLFNNSNGESVKFSYNFSNKNGKIENYNLVPGKELNVYVTTIKNIKVIYTDKEKSTLSKLKGYINKLPKNMLVNLTEIKMIPFSNTMNIAGTTIDSSIILYNFSKYTQTTQKNIIYHEIAHTWANKLMDKKIIDYAYTDYKEVVEKDNNYTSNYAKAFAQDNDGKLSEDFADSMAFYFMNQTQFKKNYPNRTIYLKNLLSKNLS